MPGRGIRIARIAGIPVGVNPLWLIIVALITRGDTARSSIPGAAAEDAGRGPP